MPLREKELHHSVQSEAHSIPDVVVSSGVQRYALLDSCPLQNANGLLRLACAGVRCLRDVRAYLLDVRHRHRLD